LALLHISYFAIVITIFIYIKGRQINLHRRRKFTRIIGSILQLLKSNRISHIIDYFRIFQASLISTCLVDISRISHGAVTLFKTWFILKHDTHTSYLKEAERQFLTKIHSRPLATSSAKLFGQGLTLDSWVIFAL
jgi:hypothetical protein